MNEYSEPRTGTCGHIDRYGVQMDDGRGNAEPMHAEYIGRRPSAWRTLQGEPLPDVSALQADDGTVYTFESLRTLLGVWKPCQGQETAEEIIAGNVAHVLMSTEGDMRGGQAVERGQIAVHSDGSVCLRAVSTRDCPYSHNYRPGEPVRYRVETYWHSQLILSASNSISDIELAIRAAGIAPRAVTRITAE